MSLPLLSALGAPRSRLMAVESLVVAAVVVLGIGLGLAIGLADRRGSRRELQHLTGHLGTTIRGSTARGTHDGAPFAASIAHRRGGGGSVFRLRLATGAALPLVVVPASGRSGRTWREGPQPWVTPDDVELESRFAVAASDAAVAQQVLADPDAVGALNTLLHELGFTELEATDRGVVARIDPCGDLSALDDTVVLDALRAMATVARTLPGRNTAGATADGQGAGGDTLLNLGLLVGSLLMLGLATWFFTPLAPWPDTAWMMAPALTALVGYCAWLLRRTRSALDGLRRRVGAIVVAVPCVPIAVWSVLVIANGALDPATPRAVSLPVLDKRMNEGGGDPNHRVVVLSPDGSGEATFRVAESDYPGIEPGVDHWQLAIGTGLLGIEWEAGGTLERR